MSICRSILAFSCLALVLLTSACSGKKTEQMKAGPAQYKVRLTTTKGDIVILVHRDWSPLGADHFYELTIMRFYNGDYFFGDYTTGFIKSIDLDNGNTVSSFGDGVTTPVNLKQGPDGLIYFTSISAGTH